MPTYNYRCECGAGLEAIRKIAERHDAPAHCGRAVTLEIMPTMVQVFTPYRAIGGDRRWVPNADEHRAFLREFNYEEVGTDSSMAPPAISDEEHAYNRDQQTRELSRDQQETSRILREIGADVANHPGEP